MATMDFVNSLLATVRGLDDAGVGEGPPSVASALKRFKEKPFGATNNVFHADVAGQVTLGALVPSQEQLNAQAPTIWDFVAAEAKTINGKNRLTEANRPGFTTGVRLQSIALTIVGIYAQPAPADDAPQTALAPAPDDTPAVFDLLDNLSGEEVDTNNQSAQTNATNKKAGKGKK